MSQKNTKTKKVIKTTVKKDNVSQKLYDQLVESVVLDQPEQDFWLEHYHILPSADQTRLLKALTIAEKELAKEQDLHLSRIAEIDAKCVAQLQKIEKSNKSILGKKESRLDKAINRDFAEDEDLFNQLRELGEM